MTAILFVCLGNICRSPTAEAVFRKRALNADLDLRIESAGTGGWHRGDPPDPRARAAGEARGYSFTGQEARRVEHNDFSVFDLILAMDTRNLRDLRAACPPDSRDKIRLFLEYAPALSVSEVPDPYYGGEDGFDHVLDLVEAASDGLINQIKAQPSSG
ncbi:MAG: low molecular weight phosphotyrosine protein phosphatase [Acidimicrobiales bacterium]|nr:low molecular weight phosphotyrosine protein phosphatase [Hyphomonadaceae bacterium]RZV43821.1 MAG: low molecular weight phosphotyrosine protein phosphatase [Acidimicrobiales bacterium]